MCHENYKSNSLQRLKEREISYHMKNQLVWNSVQLNTAITTEVVHSEKQTATAYNYVMIW